MHTIALVTDNIQSALSLSDQTLVEPLRDRRIDAVPVSWQAESAKWKEYEAVILRSCWNYHQHIEAYSSWLTRLEQEKVNVWNTMDVVRWNMDKMYLRDLSTSGVAVPMTTFIEKGEQINLFDTLMKNEWERAVVKPSIGASAHHSESVELADAKMLQKHFDEKFVSHNSGWLIQQFLPEITEGEWSFVFFQGEFSHAVLKRPAPGNIFVQKRLGGSNTLALPPAHYVSQAETILKASAAFLQKTTIDFLYARVDAIPRDETLFLIELELMELGLFLDQAGAQASQRFARAIASIVQ